MPEITQDNRVGTGPIWPTRRVRHATAELRTPTSDQLQPRLVPVLGLWQVVVKGQENSIFKEEAQPEQYWREKGEWVQRRLEQKDYISQTEKGALEKEQKEILYELNSGRKQQQWNLAQVLVIYCREHGLELRRDYKTILSSKIYKTKASPWVLVMKPHIAEHHHCNCPVAAAVIAINIKELSVRTVFPERPNDRAFWKERRSEQKALQEEIRAIVFQ